MNKETLNKIKYLANMAAHLPADVTLEDEDAALKALHGELAADTVLELIALAERTTSPVSQMTDSTIRDIFMANGFTIKEGQTDLKPYVYAAARALLAAAAPQAQAVEPVADPRPLFDRKLADLQQRGYEVIGRILHKDGEYALFDSSCRWLTQPQYWRLMHEQDGSLFATPPAAQPQPQADESGLPG